MANNQLPDTKPSRSALVADLVTNDPNIKAALTEILGLATKEETTAGKTAVQPDELHDEITALIANSLANDPHFGTRVLDLIDDKADYAAVVTLLSGKASISQGLKADTAVQPALLTQAINNLIAQTLNNDTQFGATVISMLSQKANLAALSPIATSGSAADVAETASRKFMVPAEREKLGRIGVTQNINLDELKTVVDGLTSGISLAGEWDAATGQFPGGPTTRKGYVFVIKSNNTVDGVEFTKDDRIMAMVDNPSNTVFAGNWFKEDFTDRVNTVAGRTGNVVLTSTDITDSTALGRSLLLSPTQSNLRGLIGMTTDGGNLVIKNNAQMLAQLGLTTAILSNADLITRFGVAEVTAALQSIINSYVVAGAPTTANTLAKLNTSLTNYISSNDAAVALKAPNDSPTLTGTPKTPTPADAGSDDTSIPNTAWTQTFVRRVLARAVAPILMEVADLKGTALNYPNRLADAFDDTTAVALPTATDLSTVIYFPFDENIAPVNLPPVNKAPLASKTAWRAIGSATVPTNKSKFGSGCGYVTTAAGCIASNERIDALNVRTGDFEFNAWVSMQAGYTALRTLFNHGGGNTGGFSFNFTAEQQPVLAMYQVNTIILQENTQGPTLNLNNDVFTHYRVNRKNGVLTIFRNGKITARKFNDTTDINMTAAAGVAMGGVYDSGSNPFAGYFDGVQFSNICVSNDEFVPPSAPPSINALAYSKNFFYDQVADTFAPEPLDTTIMNIDNEVADGLGLPNYTWLDPYQRLVPGTIVTHVGCYALTPGVVYVKIARFSNAPASYNNGGIVYLEAQYHPGGGWYDMQLDVPFIVPPNGGTTYRYFPSIYSTVNVGTNATISTLRTYGGQNTNGSPAANWGNYNYDNNVGWIKLRYTCRGMSQIPQYEPGTIHTDMTNAVRAFDDVWFNAGVDCATKVGGTAFIGKLFSNKQRIAAGIIKGSRDFGLESAAPQAITVELAASINGQPGVVLGSTTFLDYAAASIVVISNDTVTEWDNVWFEVKPLQNNLTIYVSEAIFYRPEEANFIKDSVGTPLGDMTAGAGLSAPFNGERVANGAQSAQSGANAGSAYIGKNLGTPTKIDAVSVMGPTDFGFHSTNGVGFTVTLFGKNGSPPANAEDGVTLGIMNSNDGATDNTGLLIPCTDKTTAYQYVWVRFGSATVGTWYCSQMAFFTPRTVTHKNLDLVSQPVPVSQSPGRAYLSYQIIPGTSNIIANTDLKGFVSRDGGVTWKEAVLGLDVTTGFINLYQDYAVDLNSIGSGTNLRMRLRSLTNKSFSVTGASLQWA